MYLLLCTTPLVHQGGGGIKRYILYCETATYFLQVRA